jgi:RNA-directed DNA polymerase
MPKLGLSINEAKTSLKNARVEDFDFLGYTFGPRYARGGKPYLGARPSKKSLKRVKGKIGDLLRPCETGDWPGVRKRLNRLIGGWSAYFGYGTLNAAYRAVDRHVCDRVRRFLNRRAKRGGRGARGFSWNAVFGKLGVQRLTRDKPAAPGP